MTPNKGTTRAGSISIVIVGGLLLLQGLALTAGGAYLAWLSGSWYFLLMGCAMLASGSLMLGRKPSSAWVFGAALILTVVWALADVGWDFWPLVSRLMAFGVSGLLVTLVYPAVSRSAGRASGRGAWVMAATLTVALLSTFAAMFIPRHLYSSTTLVPEVVPVPSGAAQKDWSQWGNDAQGTRFAAIDQINPSNVNTLEAAWTFHTGDFPKSSGVGAEDQNTPLQVGDTVFVCTAYGKVFALDADTGKQRWKYDPQGSAPDWQRCRGLGYFEEAAISNSSSVPTPLQGSLSTGDVAQPCRRRLFLPTGDARLIAINADDGQVCAGFGADGTVDLKIDMGEVSSGYYQQTSTPLVAGNLVVIGGRVADNLSTNEPPGVVRAYDVHTGALMWAWDPGNPNITKRPPPGQTYTRGTPNVWSSMAYDAQLDVIYMPTGNATPDFFGGERSENDDKWSSSVVAIEAKTGKVRWHYQTTHHDIWDFDLPAQPLLYDIPDGHGGTDPALVQVTKQGEIFVLNRLTGVPLTKVEERPVPAGNIPGERYSPTQPYSVGMPNIGNTPLTESDMWGMTPFDQLMCRIQFKRMRYEGMFTPPGVDAAVQFPGSLGGMNWGSVSVDPTTHYMFVNDMRLGLEQRLVPRDRMPKQTSGLEMGFMSMAGLPYGAYRVRWLSVLGVPCQKPPFGTMSAIDLTTKKMVWQVPVGTVQDTGPLGIRMHLPIPIGMPTLGGSLATQSGLLFFSGTQDFYLRAFDSRTGNELWKARLPVGSQSGPMTYVSPKTGRQYIVLTVGGARQSPDRGDMVTAYALPR